MRDENGKLIGGILSSKYLEAVGKVAIESAKLETEIEIFIWLVCGLDRESGRVITERIQLDAKLIMLRELTSIQTPSNELRAEWKDTTDKISDLIAKRNTIIHGEWYGALSAVLNQLPKSKTYPIAVRSRRKQKTVTVVLATEIERIAIHLARSRIQLREFFLKHWSELRKPLPYTG